jgi:LysM repeat protein
MDTLSRDSNNSGSILPLVGVIAGGLALILAAVALAQLSKVKATVASHEEPIAKISALEGQVRDQATKADTDLKNLSSGIQGALNSVGSTIGEINAKIAKIEEAQKARAVAPAGKAGAPAIVTGKVDASGNYAVAPGDTLSKIAKKFATTVDRIEAENPGISPSLKVGQKIKIPKK